LQLHELNLVGVSGPSEDRLIGGKGDRVLPLVRAGQADVVNRADAVAHHKVRCTPWHDLTSWTERVSSLIVHRE
jgi:hypothetical protein